MLICIKDKNKVMIAVSTASMKHVEMSPKDLVSENNLPGFFVKNNSHTVVVGNSSPLLIDILRYNNKIFSGKITLKRLITKIVPQIKQICEQYKILKDDDYLPTSLIIAQNNLAFAIGQDGLVTQIEDFEVIGWYRDVIKGSLRKNKNLPVGQRISHAFKESFLSLGGYEKGYFCLNTQTEKITLSGSQTNDLCGC